MPGQQTTLPARPTREDQFLSSINQTYQQLQHRTTTIQDNEGKAEPNPWLRRTGWAVHLYGLDTERLRLATSLDIQEGWGVEDDEEDRQCLQWLWESVERVIQQAQRFSSSAAVGSTTLFEVNRSEIHKKATKPFDSRLEDRTISRYICIWKRIIGFIFRTLNMEDDELPPYKLTPLQEAKLDFFQTVDSADFDSPSWLEDYDRTTLDFLVSLLDHTLPHSSYDSVLLSALAAMGIREDGGWLAPADYTGFYSAVITVGKMLVLLQSKAEIGAQEGSTEGLFSVVRQKVHRFLTRVHPSTLPTPIDWILETRAYGMKIQYDSAMPGLINWQGSTITFRQSTFSMEALTEMLHLAVVELGSLIESLAFTSYDNADLPKVLWSKLYDTPSKDRVGFSFLVDPQNDWMAGYSDWVVKRILAEPELKASWIQTQDGGALGFRKSTITQYLRQVTKFRQLLFVVIHLLSGQPARTTEILSLRYFNTPHGGQRNIFIQNGMVCLVCLYHKGYVQSGGRVKIIYRYLPREVGEHLVRYLWIILPFCQQLQATATGFQQLSPHLWDTVFIRAPPSPVTSIAQLTTTLKLTIIP